MIDGGGLGVWVHNLSVDLLLFYETLYIIYCFSPWRFLLLWSIFWPGQDAIQCQHLPDSNGQIPVVLARLLQDRRRVRARFIWWEVSGSKDSTHCDPPCQHRFDHRDREECECGAEEDHDESLVAGRFTFYPE